ncbi:MAG: hypothetical protein AB9903_02005 [Vulcanimicrobiota bacterium]
MSITALQSAAVRLQGAYINNKPQIPGNTGNTTDTYEPGGLCTPQIRNRILDLRMHAAGQKSTALKLLGIGAFFGGMVALGGSFIGAAVCGCMGLLPAGIAYSGAYQAEKEANVLERTYKC